MYNINKVNVLIIFIFVLMFIGYFIYEKQQQNKIENFTTDKGMDINDDIKEIFKNVVKINNYEKNITKDFQKVFEIFIERKFNFNDVVNDDNLKKNFTKLQNGNEKKSKLINRCVNLCNKHKDKDDSNIEENIIIKLTLLDEKKKVLLKELSRLWIKNKHGVIIEIYESEDDSDSDDNNSVDTYLNLKHNSIKKIKNKGVFLPSVAKEKELDIMSLLKLAQTRMNVTLKNEDYSTYLSPCYEFSNSVIPGYN